tara:strand:+ start:13931 stop:14164 length:234 start_codon:yes stop_codon:yes gene_type:complete
MKNVINAIKRASSGKNGDSGILILLVIALILTLLVFGPIVTIWAMNLLFGTTIQITWGTWFAALWISAIVSGNCKKS